mgnify:CR=1 FL=1
MLGRVLCKVRFGWVASHDRLAGDRNTESLGQDNPIAAKGTVRVRVVEVIRTSEGGGWILPEVKELQKRGHEVITLLPDPEGTLGERLRLNGVPVIASVVDLASPRKALSPWGLRRLRKQLADLKPDVVFYQLIQTALAVRLATIRMGVRRVHQVPGPLYLESKVVRPFEWLLSGLDDMIICGSEFTRQAYVDLGTSPAKLVAIPFGVETQEFIEPPVLARKTADALGIPDESFVAVMVAFAYPPKRLAHSGRGIKGHELMIEAWERFSHRHGDTYAVFVCDGWGQGGEDYRSKLQQESERTGRPGSVRWISGQRDSRPYYAIANVSVSPSLSENHGAALEAGAMGVPSIVSSAGGLPETVDPSCGWVFATDEAEDLLQQLEAAYSLHRHKELAGMGRAARHRIEQMFDAQMCAARVADCLEAVAGECGHGGGGDQGAKAHAED